MTEWLVPGVALVAGVVLAWLARTAQANAERAALQERLAALATQHDERTAESHALSARHHQALEALRTESERRAAAAATRTFEDGRLRPDLIVCLPGGKQIVVDAKAPIAAYLEAAEASDEATQRARLADHARQVRAHVTGLGRKAYWEQFNPSPEFVVLFLSGEMFFSAALIEDPALIEFGVNELVIPATPTTLITLLRAVAYGWRQEALAQNAQEVADLGKQLYERIARLAGHWTEVGDRLGKAVESYNRSVTVLENRVLVSARRLRELKAAPEGTEVHAIEPVERVPWALQAIEFNLPKAAGGE